MRRLVILFILLAFVLFLGIVVFPKKHSVVAPTITPTPSIGVVPLTQTVPSTTPSTTAIFCLPKDLQASISTEGAAGNIYGTVTIKNISPKPCTIHADSFISATISASNITISPQGQKGPSTIELSPRQVVYSQIHYPNGPQCSGSIKQVPVTFRYAISPTSTVTFSPTSNLPSAMTTCSSLTEKTQLDVWSISLKPLH